MQMNRSSGNSATIIAQKPSGNAADKTSGTIPRGATATIPTNGIYDRRHASRTKPGASVDDLGHPRCGYLLLSYDRLM